MVAILPNERAERKVTRTTVVCGAAHVSLDAFAFPFGPSIHL